MDSLRVQSFLSSFFSAELLRLNLDEYETMTAEEREARLENGIRELADVLKPEWPDFYQHSILMAPHHSLGRWKRQGGGNGFGGGGGGGGGTPIANGTDAGPGGNETEGGGKTIR